MKPFFKIFFVCAFMCSFVFTNAQQPDAPLETVPAVSAKVTVKTKKIRFARPIEIEVELSAPAVLNKYKIDSKDFELIPERTKTVNPLKASYIFIPFNLGELEFPALYFNDENDREIKTEPFKLEVKPTNTRVRANGLADITKPYAPFNRWIPVWVIIAAASAYGIYMLYKKITAPKARPALMHPYIADGRPYHIIALEKVEHLEHGGLWERKLYKTFYIRLVDIFREYLSVRFNIDAYNCTSRELLRKLKEMRDFKADINQVKRFQYAADQVKFAKAEPTPAERDLNVHDLKVILMDSRQPEPSLAEQAKEQVKDENK